MLVTDFTDPSTIATLLIEAALVGLAFAAAFLGVLVRPVRWIGRGLAVLCVVYGLIATAELALELWTLRPPLVLPDAPFGTYAQPTVLRLLPLQTLLVLGGGLLAFRRPGLAGLLVLASGVIGLVTLPWIGWSQDPTAPPGTAAAALEGALPWLSLGALLLATWWAERRRPQQLRPAPDTTAHPSAARP